MPRKDLERRYLPLELLLERFSTRWGMRLEDALEEMLPGLEHGGIGAGKARDEELCSDFQSSDRESSQGSIVRLRGEVTDGDILQKPPMHTVEGVPSYSYT